MNTKNMCSALVLSYLRRIKQIQRSVTDLALIYISFIKFHHSFPLT